MSEMVERDRSPTEAGLRTNGSQENLGDYLRDWFRRFRAGDIGSLPIIIGLVVIAAIFGSQEPVFFSPRNFVNLLLQAAGITAIAIGIVFVLLIAEIDLSVGYVGGVGAVIMTLLLREGQGAPAWSWSAAIATALAATTLIGLLHGLIITKFGAPSFVVTLAGLLAWSGVVLIMTTTVTTAGVVVLQDRVVLGIANNFLPNLWGWVLYIVLVGGYIVSQFLRRRMLRLQNLSVDPAPVFFLKLLGLALVSGLAVWYASQDRGIPVVAVIIMILLAAWSFIATRTRFGRYVYAVGGNPEAARRAGINVDRIRIVVFMISSFMAGVGGIILASRLRSVDTNTGGGNLLLNVIAAAVIGGTSLFGGSGFVGSALLGALVVQSVDNGMGLLGMASGTKFVVNGLVLLSALLVDSVTRRRRESSGIA